MLPKLVRSVVLWFIYFPYVAILRALGPYGAVLLGRLLANTFWLLLRLRGRTPLRASLGRVLPLIHPDLSLATAVRRHLALKQQYFVERHVCGTRRGRRFLARTYARLEGREHLDAARAAGRGVVLVSHHFDMSRMMLPALHELGYPVYQHALREAAHAAGTFAFVGRALLAKKLRDEAAGTVKIVYHQPGATFKILADLLGQGAIVGIAGDGMASGHFVEVPFLEGVTAFPTGPARLAARTGAALVTVFCLLDGLFSHRIIVYPPIHCLVDSPADVEAATRAQAGLLEQYIRQRPWSWWPWRRLRVVASPDDRLRYEVSGPGDE